MGTGAQALTGEPAMIRKGDIVTIKPEWQDER